MDWSENMREAVIRRFLEILEEKKITVNKLANLSGVAPSTVKNIFNGTSRNPGIVTIKLLCDGLGITVTEFFNSPIFEKLEIEEIE
ncbi:MAG: helix-turn-helix transcriptional regulator [Ruminiclostridium sp.]|nr:helix-turn-helix transcriptional regulator [Ruminiclostridium sp.]